MDNRFGSFIQTLNNAKTSQELRMLSSVTIYCQVTKIAMNPGSQLFDQKRILGDLSKKSYGIVLEFFPNRPPFDWGFWE